MDGEVSHFALDQIEPTLEFQFLSYKVPKFLWDKLYNFQREGLEWLISNNAQDFGGILADEMGLGKTVQIAVFLSSLYYTSYLNKTMHKILPHLVVSPKGLIYQWKEILLEWCPFIPVKIFYQDDPKIVNEWYNLQNVIIITTYGHLRIHSEIFTSKKLYYVILDEGSVIRNNNRKISVIAKSLKTNHRIISSGTPIQNNLSELWSLMDFINPGLLGDLSDFNTNFSVPISNGSYKNCTYEQLACAYNSACILRDIIKPFILRRVKFDVINEIELPDKKEKVIYVIPTITQINLYKSFLNSKEFTLIIKKKIDPLSGIMKLRKICNHPIIFSNPSYFRRHGANETKDHYYSQIDFFDSGKFLVLKSLIDSWELTGENADKILIFTQSIPMLDLVVYFLNSNNIGCLRIDGSVSLKVRSEFIKNFESVPTYSILVMSTRAGGIGINLTCANKIIILDPDWNPSIDNQAKERSWRIGQRRDVSIYRFITQGSIEEHIYKRQLLKQQVSNRILTNPKQARSESSDAEIANIFSYDFNFKEVPEDDHAASECKFSISQPMKTDRINMIIANKISKAIANIDYDKEQNSENKLPQIINKSDDFMPDFFTNLDCIKNK